MAVKRKKEKKNLSIESWKRAVKIKCCYCDDRDTCKFREAKERDENKGYITYCTLCPNKINQKKKKKKKLFNKLRNKFKAIKSTNKK